MAGATDPPSSTWYLYRQNSKIYVFTEGRLLKIRPNSKTRKETLPGPISEVKTPDSFPRKELKKYYGNRTTTDDDIILLFEEGYVIILDHGQYDQSNRGVHKLAGASIERLLHSFENLTEEIGSTEKRKRLESPPPPTIKHQKWDIKTSAYQQKMSASVSGKRVTHGTKDVFKVPLNNIIEKEKYLTREKSDAFVESIKQTMHKEMKLDTLVCLVSEGNPLTESGSIKENVNLYILGGTHYLSALKSFHQESSNLEVSAAIFQDLIDEEVVWLGNTHNKQQQLTKRVTSRDYMANFRRLLLESSNLDQEPPENPPKDWRMKCQGLLPVGKSINSYSPWLAMSKCKRSTWQLMDKVFLMYERGQVKGMKKTGNTLESHRLWREIAKLPTEEADKVLTSVVEEKFSIGEAMKDAENRDRLSKLRETMTKQLEMTWEEIVEKYGSRVASEALLPYARLDSVESIPLILHEFLEDLKDTNRVGSGESLWSRGEEVEIRMIQGTPLSPPKTNANVIILEMTSEDESHTKDEVRLIIQKNKTHLQRQLYLVLTEFHVLGNILELIKEFSWLDHEIVVLQKDGCRKHHLRDKTFPTIVRPVVILKKISNAVTQTYNMPEKGSVHNFFEDIEDLLRVCIFPSDTVVDTTLDEEIAGKICCKELILIASDQDLSVVKEKMSSTDQYSQFGVGATQN